MNAKRLRWLAAVAFVLVLIAGYMAMWRNVTVLADGRAHQLSTRAVTVGGALAELGIQLGAQDVVEPGALMPLRNGLIIALQRAAYVQLQADGELYSQITAEKDLASLLEKWDLVLEEADRVLLAGRTLDLETPLPSAAVLTLELRRSVPVTVQVDGGTRQFRSSAVTLGQALAENGIQLSEADRVSPAPETRLSGATNATVTRARMLSIELGEQTVTLHSSAANVGQALADAGIALQSEDFSQPAESEAVPADGVIRVVRVTETLQLVQESLPHEIEWQPDDEAELDVKSVIQLGQDGVQASRVRVRYEDGVEVSRLTDSQRVLVAPRTQINGYGTKIVLRTAVVDGISIEYYRAVDVYATWYSPCNLGIPGGGCSYITASGARMRRGLIATWRRWFNVLRGTTVYVPGYGYGEFADIGSYTPDLSRPWIDLAFPEEEAHTWSTHWVTMYFTTPVPANIPLIWPP